MKSKIISLIDQELFEKVMHQNISIKKLKIENDDIIYYIDGYCEENRINIYKYADKCKKWLQNKEYFNICYRPDYFDLLEKRVTLDLYDKNKLFYADTEYEVIFKACDWVFTSHKCDHKEIGTNGSCHICKLCEEYKIADVEEFRKFYNNCNTGDDYARVMYYKEMVEMDGGL